ncbi:MAG: hypothetical protein J0J01_28275 [Reyranella sp.]|uniref:hypothetical protein n=1 Tax=Reyranella sp. TaxID=1929291 RepID=UPI001AC623FA|nr:hypothetical protein [Reyranella sp.]MBN9090829.1 hypothetical protein [Reyranella sp.]
MILNIVDHRKRPYRWNAINAIIEPTSHDNSVKDSDEAEEEDSAPAYDALEGISLADAVQWASAMRYGVTLYLYDLGSGT